MRIDELLWRKRFPRLHSMQPPLAGSSYGSPPALRWLLVVFFSLVPFALQAGEHGPSLFHSFRLETDIGNSHGNALTRWDLDGWIGKDRDKLWLKSEGDVTHEGTQKSEFRAMYSRNVAEFWDAQIGLRQDIQPETTSYLTLGVDGLAPYYFETEAHLFVSDKGDTTVRIKERNDLLITQRLIAQPYLEINLSAQDVPELGIGSGITSGEVGLQTRYEFAREFAPYIDLRYESKFGTTAKWAGNSGENRDGFIAGAGVMLKF